MVDFWLLCFFTRKNMFNQIGVSGTSSCWKKGAVTLPRFCWILICHFGLGVPQICDTTVDGWNPANQLRLVVCPIIYRVSYIPGGARFQPSTVLLQRFGKFPMDITLVSMEGCGAQIDDEPEGFDSTLRHFTVQRFFCSQASIVPFLLSWFPCLKHIKLVQFLHLNLNWMCLPWSSQHKILYSLVFFYCTSSLDPFSHLHHPPADSCLQNTWRCLPRAGGTTRIARQFATRVSCFWSTTP